MTATRIRDLHADQSDAAAVVEKMPDLHEAPEVVVEVVREEEVLELQEAYRVQEGLNFNILIAHIKLQISKYSKKIQPSVNFYDNA